MKNQKQIDAEKSKKDSIIADLISGGLIGAFVGKLLTDDEEGALLGAIIGAIALASKQSEEVSKKENIPLVISKENKLYLKYPNGRLEFIKDLPKAEKEWPQQFELS